MVPPITDRLLDEALKTCESEPIHIPGSIQPHGVLLGIDPRTFEVTLATGNVADFLGWSPQEILGMDLEEAVGAHAYDRIRRFTEGEDPSQPERFYAEVGREGHRWLAEASIHRQGPWLVLELEPADRDAVEAAMELSNWLRRFSHWSGGTGPLTRFCQLIAEDVREYTRYDRTMIYRFHPDDHGEVIAESVAPDLEPFLGLHYPASDIPRQARELFLQNRVRVLVDAQAIASPLLEKPDGPAPGPLDMTFCQLRSFSPFHLEYMNNMGVRSSLVISIAQGTRLWGLLVCHHRAPRTPSHAMRAACTFLSELISGEVAGHENRVHLQAEVAAAQIQQRLLAHSRSNADWKNVILGRPEGWHSPISSHGAAIVDNDEVRTEGQVPPEETIRAIAEWLTQTQQGPVFSTNALGDCNPAFAGIAEASGLLAVEIGRIRPIYIFWFRTEQIREVTWGGDPRKGLVVNEEKGRLSPRTSFDAWRTTVHGRSAPWDPYELVVAREIWVGVLDIVLRASLLKEELTEVELVFVRKAVEATGEPVLIADQNGKPTLVNQAFTDLFGLTIDRLPVPCICVPTADPATATAILAATHGSVTTWKGEVEVAGPEGRRIPVALRINPVVNPRGLVVGFISLHFDLTEQRRVNQELEQHARRLESARNEIESQAHLLEEAKNRAEAANQAKSDFLANMSHEIRTPMNGVIGLSELLLDSELDESQRNYVTSIRASGGALLTVINDILDLSKIEAGMMILTPGDFDLAPVLKELIDLLGPKARKKGVRLTANLAVDFPRNLRGDVVRIRQILTNLAGNAIKFTDQGEVSITGEVMRSTKTEATIRVIVRDTGIGIPASKQEAIFESFVQGESGNTRAAGGTGLGLSISRRLATLMGGSLGLSSEVGRGTTFWLEVTLPIATSAPETAAVSGSGTGPAPAEAVPSLRILVAEDNQTNQVVMKGLLKRLGHEVKLVGNGKEAVEALARDRFDLVLMDLQMPVMDGYAAVAEIRTSERDGGPRTPIIAVTASVVGVEKQRCLDAGMDAYISKPITFAHLVEAIKTHARPQDPGSPARSDDFRPDDLLLMMGRHDSAVDVIDSVRASFPELLDLIARGLMADDPAQVIKACHQLRGVASTVTADALAKSCLEIEDLARAGDLATARQRSLVATDDWSRLRLAIDQFRDRSS